MRIGKAQAITGVAILATGALIAVMMRPKPLVVDAVTVARGPLEATIDADGKTRVRERYVVVAPVSGRVERITRLEGSVIHAGDVIARLRPLPLDSVVVTQARARVDAAEALVLQAAAQSRVSTAALGQRRRELARAQRLAEAGGVAPRVVEESELAVVEAEEAAHAADQRMRAAEADARQARAIFSGQGTGGPDGMVLVRAPASGRVLRIPERSERIVSAGTPLAELGDPSSLEILVDVLSSDGATIHPGDRVRLAEWVGAGDAGEQESRLEGRVREIEPAGFTKISALGVEEQRVNVIIDLDNIPSVVGDGFRVEASIIVWASPSVVVVPRSALLQRSGGRADGYPWSAFVVKAGRVETRNVRLGHAGGADAEALGGIEPGEAVVVFPSDQLKPGARVKVRGS